MFLPGSHTRSRPEGAWHILHGNYFYYYVKHTSKKSSYLSKTFVSPTQPPRLIFYHPHSREEQLRFRSSKGVSIHFRRFTQCLFPYIASKTHDKLATRFIICNCILNLRFYRKVFGCKRLRRIKRYIGCMGYNRVYFSNTLLCVRMIRQGFEYAGTAVLLQKEIEK